MLKFKKQIKEMIVEHGNLYYRDLDNLTFEIKIGQDLPGYIPSKLFFNNSLITIYDEATAEIQLYESFTKTDP